jgi:Kef-type K+ transport system membrane component KefB
MAHSSLVATISLSDHELTRFFIAVVLLMALAHLVGSAFGRLGLPRVIGEIGGGLLLGPTVLGTISAGAHGWVFDAFPEEGKLLSMASYFGLVLLMFFSGMEIRARFATQDRKVAVPLLVGATILPFLAGIAAPLVFDFRPYMGGHGNTASLVIIVGIAVAITSIPVISKIFIDLGIMHTRFARIVLAVATVEDIALWGLLAVAISLAHAENPSVAQLITTPLLTVGFFVGAMTVLPRLMLAAQRSPARGMVEHRPARFALLTCFSMVAICSLAGINLVFGALLAGMAICTLPVDIVDVVRTKVKAFALVFFTPIYFAIVGLKLDLRHHFDPLFFIAFLVFCTLVKTVGTVLAGRPVTRDWLSTANLAAALNARGGPGIVLATIAFDQDIIDERFFVTLVLVAVVTSLAAGSWFRYVLGRGWHLLKVRGEEDDGAGVRSPVTTALTSPAPEKEPVT